MSRSLAARASIALGLACAGACLVETPDFNGRACSLPAHPCIGGYECVQGVCLRAPLVVVSSPAPTVLAGTCVAGQVSLWLSDGTPAALDTSTPVTLETDGGMRLFSDSSCRQEESAVTVPPGRPDASFSFFSLRAGQYQIAASVRANRAVLEQGVSPLVRSGRCAMVDGESQVSCPIVPPVLDAQRAFVVFQSATREINPGDAGVRCLLFGTDSVSCDRSGDGGRVDVQWQVAEVPGASVRTATAPSACTGTQLTVPLLGAPVDPARAFVLFSERHYGASFGMDDYSTARLVGPTTAVVDNPGGCGFVGSVVLQVVQLPGIGVQRGATGPMDAGFSDVEQALPAPADPARSLVLSSHRFAGSAGTPACSKTVRGGLTDGGAMVHFTRGYHPFAPPACVAPGLDILGVAWEQIQVPPGDRLQRVVVDMLPGATQRLIPITPVDPERTLVLAGGQGSAGQAFGETREALLTDQAPAAISLELSDGGAVVRATRSVPDGYSLWTVYVWEMTPAP